MKKNHFFWDFGVLFCVSGASTCIQTIHGVLSEIRFLNVSCLKSPGELVKICTAFYVTSRNKVANCSMLALVC